MSYYEKYLKYKQKYLKLREQLGGTIDRDIFNAIKLLLKPEEKHNNLIPQPLHEYLNRYHSNYVFKNGNVFYNLFVGIIKGFDDGFLSFGPNKTPHAKLKIHNNIINKYIEYSSDHKPVIAKTGDNEITISFNVQHCKTYINPIINFAKEVYKVIGVLVNDEIPADRTELVNKFIYAMINIKNERIKNKFLEIFQEYQKYKIIINIQEGYSSLYVKLFTAFETYANKFSATKIICQNILEVFSDLDKPQMDSMGLTNDDPHPDQICQIEKFIDDWSARVKQENFKGFSEGRPHINGCYFSFIVDNRGSYREHRSQDVYEFNNSYKTITKSNENEIDIVILQIQNNPGNNKFYLPARPILLTQKVIQHGSRAMENGVGFGSLILTCDGIQLLTEGVINCHLITDRQSLAYLETSIQNRNLNGLWDVFDYICNPNDRCRVKDVKIHVNVAIFTSLIRKYLTNLNSQFETTISLPPIRIIAGDFNQRRKDKHINIYEEMNEPSTRDDYDIDYIFRLTEPIVITQPYEPIIHISPVDVVLVDI